MATSSLAMSDYLPSTSRQPSFLRRLIMLLLFTAGIVVWMSLLQRYQTSLPNFWMTIFADIAIALAAGLGARLLFYQRGPFTRFSTAIVTVLLALYGFGFLTNWQSGIGPLESWVEQFERNRFDWFEVAQLLGGLGIVLISLQAWQQPEPQAMDALPGPALPARRERPARTRAPKLPTFSLAGLRTSQNTSSRSRKNGRLKVKRSTRSRNQRSSTGIEKVVIARPIKPARSRRNKLFQGKPELQLSAFEEHRCPYCLDEVKRNDPRGVKECNICHTLHHADCWNVTGMCQIPHQNTLDL